MKVNKNILIIIALMIPIMVVSLYYHFNIMDEKSFATPDRLINLLNGNNYRYLLSDGILIKCAKFYGFFNFLHLTTVFQWTVALNVFFNFVLSFFIIKLKKIDFRELVFILVNLFLLDVFAFNLAKEPIQLLIFLVVYYITLKQFGNTKKILLCSMIFFLESLFFREYYIIVAGLLVLIYFLLDRMLNKKEYSKKSTIKAISTIVIFFSLSMLVMKYISPSNYIQLISRRETSENYLSGYTATLITDVFDNTNHLFYTLNYIINLIRIFLPIELLLKGIKYIPFAIYQCYVTFYIFKNLKYLRKTNIVNISIILSYFLCSATFEPDFGSLVRHESILLLFFIQMIKDAKEISKEGVINEESINNQPVWE